MMRKHNTWTIPELELLEKNYPVKTKEELRELFPGRWDDSIRMKAIRLGLKKKK